MMKTKTDSPADHRPTEEEIREYAHHIYVNSGWLPGRDLDNWLEAEAHLMNEWEARRAGHSRPQHGHRPATAKTTGTAQVLPRAG